MLVRCSKASHWRHSQEKLHVPVLGYAMDLRVVEIFASIQGESTRAAQPCSFVRLAGCDVGCAWCDTPEAQDAAAGRGWSVDQICAEVETLGLELVELTGGEPLMQRRGVAELSRRLLDAGRIVMLETSGCHPVAGLDGRIEVMMDVKTPSSGAAGRLCEGNLAALDANDEVKFPLADRDDYEWARAFLARHDLSQVRAIHFSPIWGRLDPRTLAGWMRTDPAVGRVRLAVQLHKLLGLR